MPYKYNPGFVTEQQYITPVKLKMYIFYQFLIFKPIANLTIKIF